MSVADKLKNIFTIKAPDSDFDSRYNSATLHGSTEALASQTQVRSGSRSGLAALSDRSTPSVGAESNDETGNAQAIPFLGKKTVAQQQRLFLIMLGVALALLASVAAYTRNEANEVSQRLSTVGQALVQSERLAKSASQSLVGNKQAFKDVAQSSGLLASATRSLQANNEGLGEEGSNENYTAEMAKIMPLVAMAEKNAATVLSMTLTTTSPVLSSRSTLR